ncbi:MAG: class I SAM-dependent methyltransferase [Candidatus Spyradocola sp.]
MDARSLDFPDESFDHVTAFYALLYMDAEDQCRAIAEAARVLRKGGSLCIWDAETADGAPPYLAELDVSDDGAYLAVLTGWVDRKSAVCV